MCARNPTSRRLLFAAALIALLSAGCAPTISPYSHVAYQYGVDLKVDALRLMDDAEEPFTDHERRVERIRIELQKAFEFARGRPLNEHSTSQWKIMIDPENHLIGGFLARWESEKQLSRPFIAESQRLVATAFDRIIQLESGKIRADSDREETP
ncbi:MAG: hypothetical protein HKN17_06075 [Rhodothermales bacterium]|nr:hypothetical protein [Rhodothermales bacterium]